MSKCQNLVNAFFPLVYNFLLWYYLGMKKRNKIIIITGAAVFAIALVLTIILLTLGKASGKLSVAFYGIDENQAAVIRDEIQKAKTDKISFSFRTLDEGTPLPDQIKSGSDLLITPAGKNAFSVSNSLDSKKSPALSSGILSSGTSVSIRTAAVYNSNKKLVQVPILLDNMELLVSTKALKNTGTQTITTWDDIEEFTTKAKSLYPFSIVFAGSDSETLLSLVTALTEAYSGKKACDAASDLISAFFERNPTADSMTCFDFVKEIAETPDTPLYTATQVLSRWHRERLVHPNVFQMTKNDVAKYLENDYSVLTFMTLSDHRKIDSNIMNRYTTLPRALNNGGNTVGFFPSVRTATGRNLTCPMIVAIPLSTNKLTKYTVEHILKTPIQESLSAKTGLSPVLSNCTVPDIQADDVRFFVAATNAPIQPLSASAFTEKSRRDFFAKELINYILSISF